MEEKAAATYGVYKEKCDTKVSLSLVLVVLELSLHSVEKLCSLVKAYKVKSRYLHNRSDFSLRMI